MLAKSPGAGRRISADADEQVQPGAVGAAYAAGELLGTRKACGPAMIAKPVAHLLSDLGITKSHSRPHVSNDDPYSEAHFKTLKYRPDFPQRFGSLKDARAHLTDSFAWYNTKHHHSGLALHTPHDFHHRLAESRNAARAVVLTIAYRKHPERFVWCAPTPRALPTAAWINPPQATAFNLLHSVSQNH